MTFDLLGLDFFFKDKLFGFWFFQFKDEFPRSLFGLYWSNGTLLIGFLWMHFEV
jgi:hypothetical protein